MNELDKFTEEYLIPGTMILIVLGIIIFLYEYTKAIHPLLTICTFVFLSFVILEVVKEHLKK